MFNLQALSFDIRQRLVVGDLDSQISSIGTESLDQFLLRLCVFDCFVQKCGGD